MPPRLSLQRLARTTKLRSIHRQPNRHFTCAARCAQEQASQEQDAKTTQFGFKTVPESEKEARGNGPSQVAFDKSEIEYMT